MVIVLLPGVLRGEAEGLSRLEVAATGTLRSVLDEVGQRWPRLARLMIYKAASLYDSGRDLEAAVSANMAKYAAGEAAALAVDTAIQVHGGNGMSSEYGVATLLGAVRAGRIAPVSREMILNFVAQHVLGQDRSY